MIIFISVLCIDTYAQVRDTSTYKTKEIKVIGNKIISDKFDSPVKVQSIDRVSIENKNGETLSDMLNLAGSVFIKTYGGSYSLSTISLNGLGSEHTLILLDGFRLNSYQNNQLDLNTISKDNIEEIEILNTGSSSIYGSEAIGGVVNIITKNNSTKNISAIVNGQFGSYDQKKIYLGLQKRIKRFNISIDYSKESSPNNYQYYYNNGIEKILKDRANSNYDLANYAANIIYSKDNSLLKYYTNFSDGTRNIPGIETGTAPSRSRQLDKNWYNILSYENKFDKNISFMSQLNFQNNLSNYFDGLSSESYYKNIAVANSSQLNYVKRKFELISGYEINYASLKSNETDGNIHRFQPAMFFVSKIKAGSFLKIFPSVRYDYISDIKKNVLSAKLGLNIKPFKDYKMNIKASAGNNYAAPTFNELYWKEIGNKNLKPESSVNAEAGAIFNFDLFSSNTIELTYSYIEAKDKIIWSPNSNGLWTPMNIGKSMSKVTLFEANISKDFTNAISVKINFNYSFTESLKKSKDFKDDPTYNKQIFYVPRHMMKCNLNLKYDDMGINLFYNFTGKRFTNFENTESLHAVDVIDCNIFRNFRINKINTQFKLEVNNIFNADYQMISGYPMPLRNYKLILSIKY